MLTEASLIPSEGAVHHHHPRGSSSSTATSGSGSITVTIGGGGRLPSSIPTTASAEVILEVPQPHAHTNSVNRSYSDLDSRSFLTYAFGLCAVRTALQQPMNLALARKQTSAACDAISTRAILQGIYSREGGLRGLSQGMAAMTLGCALSEVIYLFLFEMWRERLPVESDARRDAAAGYGADAVCRVAHIPLSIIAFRQMTAASSASTKATATAVAASSSSSTAAATSTATATTRATAASATAKASGGVWRPSLPHSAPWPGRWRHRQHSAVFPHLATSPRSHHYRYQQPGPTPCSSSRSGGGRYNSSSSSSSSMARGTAGQWRPQQLRQRQRPSSSLSTSSGGLWGRRSDVAALSWWRTLRAMHRENGLRTVFAGYGTTLAVGCQWSALWWALYGVFKAGIYSATGPLLVDGSSDGAQPQRGFSSASSSSRLASVVPAWCLCKDDNMVINTVASVVTGGTTAIMFNPYLVIRTNLQTVPMATLRSVTRHIYGTRGLRGFYSGLWLNVTACVVDGTLASTSYEYAKLWSDKSKRDNTHVNNSTNTSSSSSSQVVAEDRKACALDEASYSEAQQKQQQQQLA